MKKKGKKYSSMNSGSAEKAGRKGGLEITTIILIILLIVAFAAGIGFVNISSAQLGGVNFWDKALQLSVEQHEKELNDMYVTYKGNDGGFDNYEASIILAKAIEFTWKDCYGVCKGYQEPFTVFFATHPINFNKDMNCKSYPKGEDWPDIARIGEWCGKVNLNIVDESTVTAFGLSANTDMCGSYKYRDATRDKDVQWGNYQCNGDFIGFECRMFCDRSELHIDNVDWQAGTMNKGSTYSNIRIGYTPEEGLIFKNPAKVAVKEIT
jgi:hypothetical protein